MKHEREEKKEETATTTATVSSDLDEEEDRKSPVIPHPPAPKRPRLDLTPATKATDTDGFQAYTEGQWFTLACDDADSSVLAMTCRCVGCLMERPYSRCRQLVFHSRVDGPVCGPDCARRRLRAMYAAHLGYVRWADSL